MQRVIEELYYGNINPNEKLKPKDPEYDQCAKYAIELETDLLSRINDGEKEVFKRFIENHDSINQMSVVEAFIKGYKIGSLLMMEILADKEELFESRNRLHKPGPLNPVAVLIRICLFLPVFTSFHVCVPLFMAGFDAMAID